MTKRVGVLANEFKSSNTKKMVVGNINFEPGDIYLRDWQNEVFHQYIASNRSNFYINAPTGSGKSKAVMAIVAKALDLNPEGKIIIAVPQKAIGGGFATPDGIKNFPDLGLDYVLAENYCDDDKTVDESKVKAVIAFLKRKSVTKARRLLLCTHATLARAFARMEESDNLSLLGKATLWFDEAHHIMGYDNTVSNKLGALVQYCLNNQVPVNMVTATAFRGDGMPIIPRDKMGQFEKFYLPYDRHFQENCNGLSFKYDFVLSRGHWYDGIQRVIDDTGARKTIVFIPHPSSALSTGNKHAEVKRVMSLYKGSDVDDADMVEDDNGVMTIVNADGDDVRIIDLVKEANRSKKIEYLRGAETNPTGDTIDVVIGINVPKEGFDWPAASREIIVGPRGSLTDLIQMLGRTFRAHPDKGYGLEPVEIFHVMPWVDRGAVDDDELKDKFNTYMSSIMMSLIFEDIMMPPVDLKLPSLRKKNDNGPAEPNEVLEYVREVLGDDGWIKFREEAMDACTEYRSQNEDATVREANEKYQELIAELIADCDEIDEYQDEIADMIFGSFMRASFKASKLESVSENVKPELLDLDLIDQVDAVGGFTKFFLKEYCDALTLKEYRRIAHGRFIASAEKHREWIMAEGKGSQFWTNGGYKKYREQGSVYNPCKYFNIKWEWFTGNKQRHRDFIASTDQHREWIQAGSYTKKTWMSEGYFKYVDKGAVYNPDERFEQSWAWFSGRNRRQIATAEQHKKWFEADNYTQRTWREIGYPKYKDHGATADPAKVFKMLWSDFTGNDHISRETASAEQHRKWIREGNYNQKTWPTVGYPKYKSQGAVNSPHAKYKTPWSWFTGREASAKMNVASAEQQREWIIAGGYDQKTWQKIGYPKYKDQGAIFNPFRKYKKSVNWFKGVCDD